MTDDTLAAEIARVAPYANTNSEGEYTGDVTAELDHVEARDE